MTDSTSRVLPGQWYWRNAAAASSSRETAAVPAVKDSCAMKWLTMGKTILFPLPEGEL